jgi:two-component system, sensor histidine kinase PdtaS
MREGAVTLIADGTIAYSNQRFAEMLQTPLEQVGAPLEQFLAPDHRHRPLLVQGLVGNAKEEIPFRSRDGTDVWVEFSLCPVKLEEATGICLIPPTSRRPWYWKGCSPSRVNSPN